MSLAMVVLYEIMVDYEIRETITLMELMPNWWGKERYAEAKKLYDCFKNRTDMPECDRIISSIEHFYGHLEIERVGHLGLTSIKYKEDVEPRKQEIIDFCSNIVGNYD